MSWFGKILKTFSTPRARYTDARSLGSAAQDQDIEEARERLEQEQRQLSQEVENVFSVYDERLKGLASRLHYLRDDEILAEEKFLIQAQEELRAIVRRLETAVKSRRELERELSEWQDRKEDVRMRADHPRMRSELIRSELAARQLSEDGLAAQQDQRDAAAESTDEWTLEERETLPEMGESEPLSTIQPEQLLNMIREATHEAERWHALPEDTHTDDALVNIHHVRDLHTLLRRLDREQGVARDRMEFAVRVK